MRGFTNTYGFKRVSLIISILCVFTAGLQAQQVYTIKNGKMYVELGKSLTEIELDEFISRFDLGHLAIKKFIREGFRDSLNKAGWEILKNTASVVVLSKPLFSPGDVNDPVARMILSGQIPPGDLLFPAVSNKVRYGYNRFRNKAPFRVVDSVVTFFLRERQDARRVVLAGSFNNWDPDKLSMQKVDSGWIANVALQPGKHWYKFVIDGHWDIDRDNRENENDEHGNTNSVFFVPNALFRLKGFHEAKRVLLSGSFNDWNEKGLQMVYSGDGWELPLYLAEGTHTYRFIVDGKWMADPGNPDKFPNEFGEYNSYVAIGKPHLFVLEGYQDAKRVFLAGSFNGWKQNELMMRKSGSGWELPYVTGPGNHSYRFFVDGHPAGENRSLVLEPNYTFRLQGFENARSVFLAGDFNNWDPSSLPMKKENGEWVFSAHLSKGKHLYKFIVDGQWIIDPKNPLWEQNEQKTGNSVLWMEN